MEGKQITKQAFEKGTHTDFSNSMSYGDYLSLDTILNAQHPVSDSHNEVLFIILHQASELWLKLIIHEVGGAIVDLRNDSLRDVQKKLSRVSAIQSQLIQSWDVLSTLTPPDYLQFRDKLGRASGFQSYQYRMIEYLFGNKNPAMLKPHTHRPEIFDRVSEVFNSPSLYDEALRFLHRKGFNVPVSIIERNWGEPYQPNDQVKACWLEVYADIDTNWELYELAEKLVDVEDWFQQWRFRHMKTVERIIGFKMGTGGTSGVSYLQKALSLKFFPELWALRTDL